MSIFDKVKNAFSGKEVEKEAPKREETYEEILLSPMDGEVKDIKECSDPVFAQEIVGKGVMIIPSLGKVYSPVDGEISMLAETGHAVGITSDKNDEILIHIGLDTVELEGKPFNIVSKNGQKVKKGDLLVEFDIDQIKAGGKEIQSPVIITNTDGKDIQALGFGVKNHGDELIKVSK
ncbi:MAG: PTS glucose transporter subunit IIA [Anaerococcus sp.]|nr:PTS glucose transporter subunit IIA [Anaerococcus sp.]